MKTLVVCLDGTKQTKEQPNPTNIALFYDAISHQSSAVGNGSHEGSAPGGTHTKYLPGVGTQGSIVLRVLGNGFGDGIAELIVRGYTFLSRNYTPGDRIFILGFSRGATAARALAGFVCVQGLLDPSRYDAKEKDDAYLRAVSAWYLYRKGRPDLADPARVRFIGGLLGRALPTLKTTDFVTVPEIQAIGVFDTVSSLGVPRLDASGRPVFDFSIADTQLNPKVRAGLHALAADETRDIFYPTYWAKRAGIQQVVFPGMHSDVGGGFVNRGLSDHALHWMAGELASAGLDAATRLALSPNPLAPAQDDAVDLPYSLLPRSTRIVPESITLSASLTARMGQKVETIPIFGMSPYAPRATYADGRPLRKPTSQALKAAAQSFA